MFQKPKRRVPTSSGRNVTDKSQRSRSMSFSPDNVRARGRSPAFSALAATFENPNSRNLSTPPPAVTRLYPKSTIPDSVKPVPRSAAIAALTASFESAKESVESKSSRGDVTSKVAQESLEANSNENPISVSGRNDDLTIKEEMNEGEDEDDGGLPIFPYERLTTSSSDPVTDIDITKREVYHYTVCIPKPHSCLRFCILFMLQAYLSSVEFKEKFGMKKNAFYDLPKWKQNKLKMAAHLF
ncbi:hypothetical protein BHM03_00002027 [Ensete ventricosum]|nr:hypothetical protein BHM03_00002027 [Ensete ventricosum]